MGWYHVDHFGKGIFMGEARKIKYNEDFLAKYVPSKEEAIAFGKGEYGEAKFADYDSWPVVKKLAGCLIRRVARLFLCGKCHEGCTETQTQRRTQNEKQENADGGGSCSRRNGDACRLRQEG